MPTVTSTPNSRLIWYGTEYLSASAGQINMRLALVGASLRDRVKDNISVPVFPRSRPGEFPRLDTGKLQKDIFTSLATNVSKKRDGIPAARTVGVKNALLWTDVGTTLGYGTRLETTGRRSFLVRTLFEHKSAILTIIGRRFPPVLPGVPTA